MSRTPLREAFNRLKSDGLIAVIPTGGGFVVELDDRDIDNLLEAREVIETAFFERAAQVLTADGLRRARREFEQAHRHFAGAKGAAARRKALQQYLRIDRELHDRLIEASGNGTWVKLYFDLQRASSSAATRSASWRPVRAHQVQEHLDMIDALLAGDLQGARRCLRTHIRNVHRVVHEYRRLKTKPATSRAPREAPMSTTDRVWIRLNPADNVVVALQALRPGVRVSEAGAKVAEDIPAGHKAADRIDPLRGPRDQVRAGHRVRLSRRRPRPPRPPPTTSSCTTSPATTPTARTPPPRRPSPPRPSGGAGVRTRADGFVGIRNTIGILATVTCSLGTAHLIARRFTAEVMARYPTWTA